jgi:ATP-dependent Lon protease
MINTKFLSSDEEVDFMPIIPIGENETEQDANLKIPNEIIILPLRNTVLFPGVVLPITVGRDKSIKAVTDAYKIDKLIGVLAQKDSSIEEPEAKDLCKIGTVAKIVKLIKMPDGGTTIIIQGKKRFELLDITSVDPYFKGKINLLAEDEKPNTENFEAMVASIKDLATQIIQLSPNLPTEASIILKNIENPSFLINFVSSNQNTELIEKQLLLEINDISLRAEKLIQLLQRELQFAELKNKVTNKTRTELDKQQREYFLNQQLKSIKDELGGDHNEKEVAEMKKKGESKKWTKAAKELFDANIAKLERMHPSTPDYSVVYNHCNLMLDLPWEEYTPDNYDLKNAKKVLDNEHYGMAKIKNRILEYLAVLKLKGDMKSPILCFVGHSRYWKNFIGQKHSKCCRKKIYQSEFRWVT